MEITPQAISKWDRVPAERALLVEALTGISRYDLRPDVYGPALADGVERPAPVAAGQGAAVADEAAA